MGDWSPEQIDKLRSKGAKEEGKQGVTLKMKLRLLDYADTNFVTQIVTEATRGQNILDLIFTNSNRRRGIEVIKNMAISDHNSVRLRLVTDAVTKQQEGGDRQLNTTNLGCYNVEDLDEGGWNQVNTTLRKANWTGFADLSTTEMQNRINMNIEDALKQHVPLKKERGENRKLKVHHKITVLYRRKKRASRQLKSKDLYKITSLRKKIEAIEAEISNFYEEKIVKEEAKAWEQMRENPNFFYSYAKRKKRYGQRSAPSLPRVAKFQQSQSVRS